MAVDIYRKTTGVQLPPAVSADIWAPVLEQSAVLQVAGRTELPGAGKTIPTITGEPTAAWVAETDEKPVSRPTFGSKSMTPYKLAVIVPFSNEFRRDLPALYRELVRRLPLALAKKFDETVFGVSAAPGSNFDTLASAPALTVDGTGTFQDVLNVQVAVAAAGGDLSHWVTSLPLYATMLGSVNGLGQQYFTAGQLPSGQLAPSIFGAPVVKTKGAMRKSTTVGDDTGIAGDFANSMMVGVVEGVTVRVSDQATINDGGTALNLWQRNMFAVLAEIELGCIVRDINHFVRISDGVVDTP